ncbi:MAG: hypothetical protein JOZ99_00660 [Actinobacteria bacterium]|nr:hypothetical protein [Actinomycetota bacterium]
MKRLFAVAAGLSAAALLLAACGAGGYGNGGSSKRSSAPLDTGSTVTTKRIAGRTVLVAADGRALYTPEQEAGGMIRCTGACLQIWEPLTPQAAQPTGAVGSGTLGVLARPDGTRQVTFNGNPVYRFVYDRTGTVNGDGFRDAFGGQQFTWHVVTAGDGASSTPSSTAPSSSSGFGY